MKTQIAIIATAAALAACTPTGDMIQAQQSRCTQVGYAQGTLDHAQCVERGTLQQQQVQGAIATGAATSVVQGLVLNALW